MGQSHPLCPVRTRPCPGLVMMGVPVLGEAEMSLSPDVGQSENSKGGFI